MGLRWNQPQLLLHPMPRLRENPWRTAPRALAADGRWPRPRRPLPSPPRLPGADLLLLLCESTLTAHTFPRVHTGTHT